MVIGYESERMTTDCDPWGRASEELIERFKEAKNLSGVELELDHQAGVAQFPENFESRLQQGELKLKMLTILYPERHDLALSKIARLNGSDMDDLIWLHKKNELNTVTLFKYYMEEFRPVYIGRVQTLDLNFLDAVEELFGKEKMLSFESQLQDS